MKTPALHKAARVNYKRNRVVVYGIDKQFQADLVDMSIYSKENDNFKYMLTCIDVLMRFKNQDRPRGGQSI